MLVMLSEDWDTSLAQLTEFLQLSQAEHDQMLSDLKGQRDNVSPGATGNETEHPAWAELNEAQNIRLADAVQPLFALYLWVRDKVPVGTEFSCKQGTAADCKACRHEALRTANNQCTVCNDGFFLDGSACKPAAKQVPSEVQGKLNSCLNTYASQLDTIAKSLGDGIRARRLQGSAENTRGDVIFGAGFGTTATTSLAAALRALGLKGEHYGKTNFNMARPLGGAIDYPCNYINKTACKAELAKKFPGTWRYGKDFLIDAPTGELFVDIFATYPNAKFILTHRPSKEWAPKRKKQGMGELAPYFEPCGDKVGDHSDQELSQMFDFHSALVRCLVPRENLFEINVWEDPAEKLIRLMGDLAQFVGKSEFVGTSVREFPLKNGQKIAALESEQKMAALESMPFRLVEMGNSSEICSFEKVVMNEFSMASRLGRPEVPGIDLRAHQNSTDMDHIPSSYVGLLIQAAARKGSQHQ
jgi:hypothetical protein